jgi:kumamolisin
MIVCKNKKKREKKNAPHNFLGSLATVGTVLSLLTAAYFYIEPCCPVSAPNCSVPASNCSDPATMPAIVQHSQNNKSNILKPYFKLNNNVTRNVIPDANDTEMKMTPHTTTMRPPYYLNTLSTYYKIPPPTLTSKYVVSIVSFGGGLCGDFDSTGCMRINNKSDVYNYLKYIGIPQSKYPKIYLKLLNGAKNDIKNDGTIENSLDVISVAAFCPSSLLTIILYIAPNRISQFVPILNTINTDINTAGQLANCVSISWGLTEIYYGESNLTNIDNAMKTLVDKGINICVASGDYGSSDGVNNGIDNVNFPSSSPYCTAVGGTSLQDTGVAETGWKDGGGGISAFFPKPSYQNNININSNKRNTPDCALLADPTTGINYYVNGKVVSLGGTSCGAPMLAGFLAAMDTRVLLNPIIYGNSNWNNDIVTGSNGTFFAGTNYDNVTGLGSIKGDSLGQLITANNRYIVLNQTQPLSLVIPDTFTASATYNTNLGSTILWTSSFPDIASVDNGVVTAKSQGTATITATLSTHSNISSSFIVNVTARPIITIVQPNSTNLYTTAPNNTIQLSATVTPLQSITWSSSNTDVATVSASGLVTAKKADTVTITAAVGSISERITFNIQPHTISISRSAITKTSVTLIATVGTTESGSVVSWSMNSNRVKMSRATVSNNTSAVTISSSTRGRFTIRATNGTVSRTAVITIK